MNQKRKELIEKLRGMVDILVEARISLRKSFKGDRMESLVFMGGDIEGYLCFMDELNDRIDHLNTSIGAIRLDDENEKQKRG